MTELYTLMRYLQAGLLKDVGIQHFDEWAADFGEVVTDFELKPESDGQYQLKTRFAKFMNLPELMSMFKECADIKTSDTLPLDRPEKDVKEVVAEPSKIQRKAIKSLGKRASKIRSGSVDPREDNMLKITSDGRKIGLDQRLLDPSLPDDPHSKVNMCVRNVFDIYEQTKAQRSTQLIFCDLSTPKPESRQDCFYVYRKNVAKPLGYEMIRKKVGIKADFGFDEVKKHIKENAQEESDKLRNGDVVVIRRPSEDMESIVSQAAVYTDGVLIPDNTRLEDLEMSEIQDMPPKGFNVYDDIKDKLIAKGVPEDEIAFIHDYDTAEKKQKLFDKMNAGEIRVLLGSTSKCGAGMNAQRKMIALHHLDCPMRPSDMEQRDGRIWRQGNENKQVQIYRYVTDKSFDSYLYQMLENKQRFISQVMTSKTPERTCSDIDEQALDYAEVKALCAGNSLIKREMDLQGKIKDLKMEKSRYSERIYEMQDNIRVKYPNQIKLLETNIERSKADLDTAENNAGILRLGGRTYDMNDPESKKAGAEALNEALNNPKNVSAAVSRQVEIGEYCGMKLSMLFDDLMKSWKGCLEGDKPHYLDWNIHTDVGNITRMDNCISHIGKEVGKSEEKLETLKAELVQMEQDVNKPFAKSDELRAAETELDEVHMELTKFTLTDDTAQKEMFERLVEMFTPILTGDIGYQKYTAEGDSMEPFIVEMEGDVLTLAHIYVQNGDLMWDPRIDFKIDYEDRKATPISYEMSGLGIYEDYDIENPTPQLMEKINEMLDYTDGWLDNVEAKDYEPIVFEEKAHCEEHGRDI